MTGPLRAIDAAWAAMWDLRLTFWIWDRIVDRTSPSLKTARSAEGLVTG